MLNICCVIVTYDFISIKSPKFNRIFDQVSKTIVIDNGSCRKGVQKLLYHANHSKVDVYTLCKNLGLGAAQNIGIKKALRDGYSWILFIDQDSAPTNSMIHKMVGELLKSNKRNRIGIVAPTIIEKANDKEVRYIIPFGKILFKWKRINKFNINDKFIFVISSGSMVRADILAEFGGVKEKMFIDYIDSKLCIDVLNSGYSILVARDAFLYHRLGDKVVHRIFGKEITTTNHDEYRRYTIYRNRSYIWKKHYHDATNYVVFDLFAAIYDCLKILFLEQNKRNKFTQICNGLKDGILRFKI